VKSWNLEALDLKPSLPEILSSREGTLTLVYSAQDTEHNDAVVLAEVLRSGLPKG
jgi:uncharacterized protein YeaO (DUF488 family)